MSREGEGRRERKGKEDNMAKKEGFFLTFFFHT
jgi:hypothetical protein